MRTSLLRELCQESVEFCLPVRASEAAGRLKVANKQLPTNSSGDISFTVPERRRQVDLRGNALVADLSRAYPAFACNKPRGRLPVPSHRTVFVHHQTQLNHAFRSSLFKDNQPTGLALPRTRTNHKPCFVRCSAGVATQRAGPQYREAKKTLSLQYSAAILTLGFRSSGGPPIQMVLELVIRRVLELKHELVKWNPPNVDVRFPPPALEQAFPWDYVNLDDILVDLKLSPDTLDIAVPRRERARVMSAIWEGEGRGGEGREMRTEVEGKCT